MDYVECTNCGFLGLIPQGEERCLSCQSVGSLKWTYAGCCNAEITIKEGKRVCSKCEKEVK